MITWAVGKGLEPRERTGNLPTKNGDCRGRQKKIPLDFAIGGSGEIRQILEWKLSEENAPKN